MLVYAHSAVFGAAGVSAFWSLVNERFDPHSAKKIVGRIAGGGTVGGILGGLLAWRAASILSVPTMLAILAGFNLVGLWGALRTLPRDGRRRERKEPREASASGVRALRETPYLRDLAALVLTGAILQALLDWLLSAKATALYGKGSSLLAFFALFNMVVGVASFAAQTGLSRVMLERLGLGGTVRLQPIFVAVFAGLGLVAPGLSSVVALRGVEAVSRNSFFRSAYELFYTPLPKAQKRSAKTLIDVGFDRIGTMIGSGGLLVAAQLAPDVATRVVLLATAATAAVAAFVSTRLQDGYVSALAASLRSGAVALAEDDALDLTTRKTLAETTAFLDREKLLARIEQFQKSKLDKGEDASARVSAAPPPSVEAPPVSAPAAPSDDPLLARAATLRSGDVARVKAALATPLPPTLAPFVIPLLGEDAVVRDAVRALRKIAPKITGLLVDGLLDHDLAPAVRRRIPRVLRVCRTQRAASGLLFALRDPLFEVRVQVALGLAQLVEESSVRIDRDDVFEVAVHELTTGRASWTSRFSTSPPPAPESRDDDEPAPRSRRSATEDLHRGLAHVFVVLGLALEREPLQIAYRALRSDDAALRGTAHEYLEVVLPPRIRDLLVPLLGDVKPPERARERPPAEIAEELLRSHAALPRPGR